MSFIVENSKACLNGQCFQFLKPSGGSAMSKGQLQEIKASFNWLSETRKRLFIVTVKWDNWTSGWVTLFMVMLS